MLRNVHYWVSTNKKLVNKTGSPSIFTKYTIIWTNMMSSPLIPGPPRRILGPTVIAGFSSTSPHAGSAALLRCAFLLLGLPMVDSSSVGYPDLALTVEEAKHSEPPSTAQICSTLTRTHEIQASAVDTMLHVSARVISMPKAYWSGRAHYADPGP